MKNLNKWAVLVGIFSVALTGLVTAHANQFAKSRDEEMGAAIAIDPGVVQDQEPSVPGIYLLVEMNGTQLPAVSWTTKPSGQRCRNEILEGALIFDAEGRSAAFVTDREVCLHDDGSESAAQENSVIFPGSYVVSGNQITIEDDFGTDEAVLNGNILLYKTGGAGEPVTELAFRKLPSAGNWIESGEGPG